MEDDDECYIHSEINDKCYLTFFLFFIILFTVTLFLSYAICFKFSKEDYKKCNLINCTIWEKEICEQNLYCKKHNISTMTASYEDISKNEKIYMKYNTLCNQDSCCKNTNKTFYCSKLIITNDTPLKTAFLYETAYISFIFKISLLISLILYLAFRCKKTTRKLVLIKEDPKKTSFPRRIRINIKKNTENDDPSHENSIENLEVREIESHGFHIN